MVYFFVDHVTLLYQIVLNYCLMHGLSTSNAGAVFCQLLSTAWGH